MRNCPICGSNTGYYAKLIIYGIRRNYLPDGSVQDDKSGMYEGGGKGLYCNSCNRLITNDPEKIYEKEDGIL